MTCSYKQTSYAAQTRFVVYSTRVDPNSGRSHVINLLLNNAVWQAATSDLGRYALQFCQQKLMMKFGETCTKALVKLKH